MPLDDAEWSVLAETERSLSVDDPDLDRLLRCGGASRRRARVAIVVAALLLIVGLCWLGLAGHAFVVLLLAVAVLLGTGWRPRSRSWVPAALRAV
jgi:hypothetical protein